MPDQRLERLRASYRCGRSFVLEPWEHCDCRGCTFARHMRRNWAEISRRDAAQMSSFDWYSDSTVDPEGATVDIHVNGASSADESLTSAQNEVFPDTQSLTNLSQFMQAQLRISGSFTSFIFRGYELNYLDGPMPYVLHDTGFIDLGMQSLSWVRKIRIKARGDVALTVTPYFDGVAYTSTSFTPTAGVVTVHEIPLGREAKGKQARGVVTSSTPTQIYWIEFEYNNSGKQRQKRIERFAGIR